MTKSWHKISKNSATNISGQCHFSRPLAEVSATWYHCQNQLIHFQHTRGAQIAPINLSIILFLANLYHIRIFGGEWAGPCLEVKPDVEEDEGDGDEKTD
jgi:hypothetical protein